MPTKEEILKKLKIDYSKLSCPEDYAAEGLFLNALEEYAKQEAFGLLNTYIKLERVNFPLDVKDGFITSDSLWKEYQKSKLKK